MNNHQQKHLKGFTLIEILIIVTLIVILAVGVITLLNPVGELDKARDAKRKSDLAQIQRLLELYYNDNESYPANLNFGNAFNPYTAKLPNDPKSNKNYAYRTTGARQNYFLYASLDRGGKDPQACTGVNNLCPNAGALTCGAAASAVCNYGVTSSSVTP